ncbi:hypothetical protein KAM448_35250 [Aeromonas caviae]|uniref:Uncharacterized protein n=1 Tax=Aeromonas caviae TaxID=648 RepID=A0ABD0B849_AERCA|nr:MULTISPECIES: hypothetical protein [Aeromonas]BCK65791.1 hypothetical protein KAM330_47800 [Aeromonas hydrophila]BCR31383.1 hypothetical protein KAM376_43890 [Aeromonas caviae]GJA71848.1 hypothetical protein KAM353_14950 [Aeromonas caviae]GJA81679.1 hypothetical protein KAM355_22390 [Aeromonas caviae]GJB00707.1 hypothetical protein KAM359_41140 [Aeromonas caviae]
MSENNLVSVWVNLKTSDGSSIQNALDELNSALGIKLTHSRLKQYQTSNALSQGLARPYRRPSINIINYMLADVLSSLLMDEGLSDESVKKIISKVSILGD